MLIRKRCSHLADLSLQARKNIPLSPKKYRPVPGNTGFSSNEHLHWKPLCSSQPAQPYIESLGSMNLRYLVPLSHSSKSKGKLLFSTQLSALLPISVFTPSDWFLLINTIFCHVASADPGLSLVILKSTYITYHWIFSCFLLDFHSPLIPFQNILKTIQIIGIVFHKTQF